MGRMAQHRLMEAQAPTARIPAVLPNVKAKTAGLMGVEDFAVFVPLELAAQPRVSARHQAVKRNVPAKNVDQMDVVDFAASVRLARHAMVRESVRAVAEHAPQIAKVNNVETTVAATNAANVRPVPFAISTISAKQTTVNVAALTMLVNANRTIRLQSPVKPAS
jgi:hypothetical protein